jgi:hypothetical protein
MARKAVQGFPEKSYYDNTRYLGIVATTDPLNEGLFKHMVNFDISDTGQSVQPREGFLTTRLNNISLSNNTIIYKDNTLGDYVLFDIPNNVAYLADISGYNVQNYYLPVKSAITNKHWDDLFRLVLVPQVDYVRAWSSTLSVLITKFVPFIKPIPDTKIEHIYDENGISRALVKVRLDTGVEGQTPFDFILQLRYRQNEIGPYEADTLIIEGLPSMFDHPTFAPTERNIAVSKSIIPEIFQTLYTKPRNVDPDSVNPRPDGHISNLGSFVYIYDDVNNYVNNFIYRNTNYNIKPYFSLNPAYIDLNNNPEATDKWAYKFELFNTSTEISDKVKNVIYTSPWMKYEGPTVKPVPIFTNDRSTDISLGNDNKNDNHYNGSRYIIFTVPKTVVETQSTELNGEETLSSGITLEGDFINNGVTLLGLGQLHTTWNTAMVGVSDIKTLREAVRSISTTAFFYLYDLQATASAGTFNSFDASMESLEESLKTFHTIDREEDSEYNIFLTGDDLIERIEELNIFTTNENITFKLIPYASKDERTVTNTIVDFTSDTRFSTSSPYYVNGNPEDTLTTLFNTRVQDITTGKVYRQTISPEGDTYVEVTTPSLGGQTTFKVTNGSNEVEKFSGDLSEENICSGLLVTGTGIPADTRILYKKDDKTIVLNKNATATGNYSLTISGSSINFLFVENNYYRDTRTNRYFQWRNEETTTGQLTSVANPGKERKEYRWFFATLQYFNNVDNYNPSNYIFRNYATYNTLRNTFINNDYGFYKYNFETGTYSIETDLDLLNLQWPGIPTLFTSSSVFGQQVPYYSSVNPNGLLKAITGTYIQNSVTGQFYVKTNTSPTSWINVPISAQPGFLPSSFTKGSFYFDQRNLGTVENPKYRTFVWENTSNTGYYTEVGNIPFPNLRRSEFFDKGISGIFYMRPYEESELLNEDDELKTFQELETLKVAWGAASFRQTFNVTYGFDALTVTYIDQVLDTFPEQIQTSNSLAVFEESRLLVWNKNVLFISEEGRFYWFKERNRIEFGEEIVKVLQYKQIILVFTTQHLYAVYRVETTTTQLNTATNQIEQNVTGVAWLKQIVLYNLLVSKKYTDVIQIFNQMVLFYSEDGQLFMIRPSNTIDDQTRFNIQFFNKAANDILEHYDEYINERLAAYAKDTRITKDQVRIKALVSINFIKILYYVPGVITYMLVYDVINNRYFAYDSLTFTNIFEKRFIDSGDLFITEYNSKLFFTFPFTEANIRDNHADMTFTNNFKKEGINCLIDTGNMNLNNHLNKRFRDLHVTFKNLNASNVLFNVETMIDEIIARPFYNEQLEVREIGGATYLVTVPKFNDNDLIELVDVNQVSETATDVLKYSLTNNLFETNNVLMDFSQYTSSKLLTHRTSILGLGKVFRIKLQFISKGIYKLQHFGIIYKERRV